MVDPGTAMIIASALSSGLNVLGSLFGGGESEEEKANAQLLKQRYAISQDAFGRLPALEAGLNAPIDMNAMSNMSRLVQRANQGQINKYASMISSKLGSHSGMALGNITAQGMQSLYGPMAELYNQLMMNKEQNKQLIYGTRARMARV